jgi:Arc/MetJ family transcription regulator
MEKNRQGVKMKRTTILIDEKLIKAGLKATGLKTHKALVDYALRDLLRRESPKRILQLKKKERKQREGYKRKPVKPREFGDWEAEQVWVEP